MARPKKTGLDYFPFDVDTFEDEKMVCIAGEFGIKGEITVIKLFCAIYRNGYFIEWNEAVKLKLLRQLPGISSELFDQILNRLLRWGFFDVSLFESVKVLTSRGIQKRYFEVTKHRTDNNTGYPYLLIEKPQLRVLQNKTEVLQNKTGVLFEHNPTNKIKVNEIKEKKEVEEKKNFSSPPPQPSFQKIIEDFYEKNRIHADQLMIPKEIFFELGMKVLSQWELRGWKKSFIKPGAGEYDALKFIRWLQTEKNKANETLHSDRFQNRRGTDTSARSAEDYDGTL